LKAPHHPTDPYHNPKFDSGEYRTQEKDIKACRREITNVYTKGTYNPGKASGEKENMQGGWSRNPGKWRYQNELDENST